MISQDRSAMEATERREAAKRDAMILAEADVIRNDTERFSLAKQMAAELALETANQSKAYISIASGLLNYPKMDAERVESQIVAPSAGS